MIRLKTTLRDFNRKKKEATSAKKSPGNKTKSKEGTTKKTTRTTKNSSNRTPAKKATRNTKRAKTMSKGFFEKIIEDATTSKFIEPNDIWVECDLNSIISASEQKFIRIVKAKKYGRDTGYLIATNRRLIFVGVDGSEIDDYPYKSTNSLRYKKGVFFGKIILYVYSRSTILFEGIGNNIITDFCEEVKEKIDCL